MEDQKLTGTLRKNIFEGALVEIIQKHHQRTGELTEGLVVKLLTKSPQHSHGIKVQLDTGE
ncbi:MAG: putative repeat protein (TIGR03833 family), partial [Halieaceae bacterium]